LARGEQGPDPEKLRATAEAFQRAVSLHQRGQSLAAAELYQAVLGQDPDHPDALHQLSVLRIQLGDFDGAMTLIRRLLDRSPNLHHAHNNLGIVLHALNRPADAVEHFKKAILIKPDLVEAHYNLGKTLQALDRLVDARVSYERAIALRPNYPEAHNNLGNVLLALHCPEQTIAYYTRALEIRPGYADAHNNRGNALQALDRYAEAVASYEQALTIEPNHAEAHNNLGFALTQMNRHEEAIGWFAKAHAIKSDYFDARHNEGLARLALGDFACGWTQYEWRPERRQTEMPRPLWLGDRQLNGRTILLHGEQGLGDTIQFARYVPLVARLGARVILAAQRPLTSLLATLPGISVLRAQGDAIPPFDCFCPLPSLPLAFRTTIESIPAAPYLSPVPERVAHWRARIVATSDLKVGVVWAGSPMHRNDRNRSTTLQRLTPLFGLPGVRFFSLQVGPHQADPVGIASTPVIDLSDQLSDFAETAAAIANLDVVITVDTAVAHLAGALGRPAWVMLAFSPDWRWLRDRTDSAEAVMVAATRRKYIVGTV
jgi:tetratricopeptide (TPR) repeat protein